MRTRKGRTRPKPRVGGSGARHAVVLVLGDVGRSPRMQYHALSLARLAPERLRVSLAGHAGESCVPDIAAQANLDVVTFAPRMTRLPRGPLFAALAPIKALVQLAQLLWLLLVTVGRFDLVLLQNPPTIPTFVVVWLCCRLRRAAFVIDWHNLGFSILALSLGDRHPLVRVRLAEVVGIAKASPPPSLTVLLSACSVGGHVGRARLRTQGRRQPVRDARHAALAARHVADRGQSVARQAAALLPAHAARRPARALDACRRPARALQRRKTPLPLTVGTRSLTNWTC